MLQSQRSSKNNFISLFWFQAWVWRFVQKSFMHNENEWNAVIACSCLRDYQLSLLPHALGLEPHGWFSDVKPTGVCCRYPWQLKVTRDWNLTWQNSSGGTCSNKPQQNWPLGGTTHQNPSMVELKNPTVNVVALMQSVRCPTYSWWRGPIRVNEPTKLVM